MNRGDPAQIIFINTVVKRGEQKSPWTKWLKLEKEEKRAKVNRPRHVSFPCLGSYVPQSPFEERKQGGRCCDMISCVQMAVPSIGHQWWDKWNVPTSAAAQKDGEKGWVQDCC